MRQLCKMVLMVVAVFFLVAQDSYAESANSGYSMGTGDIVNIRVFGEDKLSGTFAVDENGMLELPLVGFLEVGGSSSAEVAQRLTHVLKQDFLVDPQVSVEVASYSSRSVQVLGAVRSPGVFQITGPTTLLELIATAGGVDSSRSSNEVRIQYSGERKGQIDTVKVDRLLGHGEGNRLVSVGDVVYVTEGDFVYVSGEVVKPGPVLYRDGLTIMQAIGLSGGTAKLANMRAVYLLRDGVRMDINLKKVMRGRDPDIDVQPGDQVFVEQSNF